MSTPAPSALAAVTRACDLRRTAEFERIRAVAAARAVGCSLRAIAEAAGVSTPRVHQMLAKTDQRP